MTIEISDTALMTYLHQKGSVYHGKVLELREAVEGWLAYIPNTFPHYTRHTVRHSDEIVLQLSKLLFKDEDPSQIVLPLTAVEAYCLLASAYLHDAGMVTSDQEKVEVLGTKEWNTWVSGEGGGAKRWTEIQNLRNGNAPENEAIRYFLADLQTRFLIAEFIRRVHHLRAQQVIDQHSASLGRFSFDDPMLQQTVANICVAHGFRTYELEDQERFPDRRDIRGQAVNVRLMAILLRLGDLLDMTSDRACPILLNAACPLPANSYAHWTQYRRITHRLTAPDRIEIRAECETQEEHRLLQDWCQWIVDEVHASRTLLFRSMRHRDYVLPMAEIEGRAKTIEIRPAENASYFPSNWTFELDHDAVFQRLVFDVYDSPNIFIRELLQNALDANRCQMYADLVNESIQPPQFPTQVAQDRRRRYPITVSLSETKAENPLSQELETQQVLTLNDRGIGMDKEIIERYFLQVGRSFYTTDQFRRNFRFVPTSRFGIGFLSVFAASDEVLVETFKPSSPSQDGPIRLKLTGPRSYLLTESGVRRNPGTEVRVVLRQPMQPGALTELISYWCRRVEFPVTINDLGSESTVTAESPAQFVAEVQDVTQPDAKFVIRAFESNRTGLEGDFYVFARMTPSGEEWGLLSWFQNVYLKSNPQAASIPFPSRLRCLHGISMSREGWDPQNGYSERLDHRGEMAAVSLSRIWAAGYRALEPETSSRWEEILTEHLNTTSVAKTDEGWRYKQRLADIFALERFWNAFPEMIPLYISGERRLVSLDEAQQFPHLYFVTGADRAGTVYQREDVDSTAIELDGPTLFNASALSRKHWEAIVESRRPTTVSLKDGLLVVEWSRTDNPRPFATETLENAHDRIVQLYLAEAMMTIGA